MIGFDYIYIYIMLFLSLVVKIFGPSVSIPNIGSDEAHHIVDIDYITGLTDELWVEVAIDDMGL